MIESESLISVAKLLNSTSISHFFYVGFAYTFSPLIHLATFYGAQFTKCSCKIK